MLIRVLLVASLLAFGLAPQASAQDINLQPKYGSLPKNDAQKAADARFVASVDDQFKGDRRKAAAAAAGRGWQYLRQGNAPDAMRRFNQAWLLDSTNGAALWGMAAIQAGSGKIDESLELFAEAERYVGNDMDFSVDHAKALGVAGAQASNDALLKDAFARFERLHARAPQHTLNLQNWAITLFYVGNYTDAWNKVKLAEATPRSSDLDPRFLAALAGDNYLDRLTTTILAG